MTTQRVILYSTQTCPFCKMAKSYFKEKGVPYTEYDVGNDQARAEEMVQKSGQMGVPVIDIDGQIIIGFNQAQIESALK